MSKLKKGASKKSGYEKMKNDTEPAKDSENSEPSEQLDQIKSTTDSALEENLDTSVEELKKLKEQYLLLAADFDNYRKRMNRQMEENTKYANEQILKSLIEVVDNLERALASTDEKESSLVTGIENVHRQLLENLSSYGLKKIKSEIDADFDPNYHEAVVCVPVEEGKKPGTINDIFLEGYELNGKIIRPANVSVREDH